MTAVRAAARAVLVLACLAAMLWPAYGPRAWTPAWVVLACVVTGCAVRAWYALTPKGDGDG